MSASLCKRRMIEIYRSAFFKKIQLKLKPINSANNWLWSISLVFRLRSNQARHCRCSTSMQLAWMRMKYLRMDRCIICCWIWCRRIVLVSNALPGFSRDRLLLYMVGTGGISVPKRLFRGRSMGSSSSGSSSRAAMQQLQQQQHWQMRQQRGVLSNRLQHRGYSNKAPWTCRKGSCSVRCCTCIGENLFNKCHGRYLSQSYCWIRLWLHLTMYIEQKQTTIISEKSLRILSLFLCVQFSTKHPMFATSGISSWRTFDFSWHFCSIRATDTILFFLSNLNYSHSSSFNSDRDRVFPCSLVNNWNGFSSSIYWIQSRDTYFIPTSIRVCIFSFSHAIYYIA